VLLFEETAMTRHLPISLLCFALICSASAEAQILQPGVEPQPLPGTPTPDFTPPRNFPRASRQTAPARTRPGQRGTNTAGPNTPAGPGGPAATRPRQPALNPFAVPAGLSEPIENLLTDLGYQSGKSFPLTPGTSYDLAFACFANGYYADAIVLASHGLQMCNDARLHLVKGVCELHQGCNDAAEHTATEFRSALADQQLFGIEAARERINDPWAVRFADMVQYQAIGR
jgi:hypothetical protein